MKGYNILIGMESSGVIRDAFIKAGHSAISCDLLPTEAPGPHYQGDIRDIIYDKWDLIIAHPVCTFLTNAGVRWLYQDSKVGTAEDRWPKMREAAAFFKMLYTSTELNGALLALENPIPHSHAGLPPYSQTIQPWEYGHTTSKRTCLWLKGLPNLKPTDIIPKELRTQDIWMASPSADRWKIRSRSFEGIGDAMAEQWGSLIPKLKQYETKSN